jgi:hypothetical protein
MKIYGGFVSTETQLSARNAAANITILSGDFSNDDYVTGGGSTLSFSNNTENAYHVIISADLTAAAVIDGFTIEGGNADGSGTISYQSETFYRRTGGGMSNRSSSPTITNSTFANNNASFDGGGMYNYSSSPTITNSTFANNNAGSSGGGMFNRFSYSLTITNSTFADNSADYAGGGMYSSSSSPTITNSTFADNNSATNGGGIFNYVCTPTITNSTFTNNNASNYGGGMYNYDSSPNITNSTFANNSATNGGGIFNYVCSPIITNTIIWNNGSSEISNSNSTPTFKNSIIRNSGGSGSWNAAYGTDGGANLDADPLFVDAANGDYRLTSGSPAIDAGDVSANTTTLDLAGNPRFDGVIDMGAYEFQNTVNVDFTAADICADATEWLVPIEVGTVSWPIGAISLVLDYDNTEMTFDAVSSNNLNATIGATGNLQVNDVNGKLYISWQDNNGQSVSNQSLMTLRFIPINSAADFSVFAGTTTDFTWDESVVGNCELADNAGNVLSTNFNAQLEAAINNAPTPTFSNDASISNTICAGETVIFTAGGGNTYEFSVGGVLQGASAIATLSISNFNGQVVTVEVTNLSGCSATSTAVPITVNPLPTPPTLVSGDLDSRVCVESMVTFNATTTDPPGTNNYIFLVGSTIKQQGLDATYVHTTPTTPTAGEVISVIGVNTTTGCQGTSTTTFTLDVDDCYNYLGTLVYDNASETPMGNVEITLTGANDIQSIITDVTDGTFTLTDLFDQETYTATYMTTKAHGGTNSTDALIIFLRSLSLFTYSNNVALKDTASDVNGSGDILTVDALQVQLRFVTTISTFAAGNWAFGTNTLSVNGINATAQKIYALAMGDVNGSYTPDIAENAKVTLQNNGSLMVNDGDRIMIPVRMEQREVLGAISMVMNISPTMTVHNVVLADNSAVQYHINGNELKIGWYSSNPLDLATGDVLFYIDATISDAAQFIANPITLSNESELADDIAAAIDNAVVSIPTMNTLSTNLTTINGEEIGIRNFPNPFHATTMIEYTLPTAAEVSIITYNSLGQPINQIVNANHVAGIHQVTWDASDLPSGMYFYTITIDDGEAIYTATKSVLLSK